MTSPEFWSVHHTEEVTPARQIWNQKLADEKIQKATRLQEHIWIAACAYFVHPPMEDGAMLDAASMIGPPMVGCFICEEEWSPRIAHRRCKGEPKN